MFWKMVLAAICVLAILWAAGFDFEAAKASLAGTAQSNAESVMGSNLGDDWGA
jgi:hypothetical protein